MAGSVVRTYGVTKNLLARASGVFTSCQTVRSLHRHLASSGNRSPCPCQVCCQRYAKSSAALSAGYGAGFSNYSAHSSVKTLYVGNKELQGASGNVSSGLSTKSSLYISQVRHKSKSTQQDTENEEDDSDQDDALNDDDFEAPPQFKVQKITAASNRADAVISHALNISRNQLEEIFLKSGLYLNGEKLLKKAAKMDTGDYADVVLEKTEDQLKVKRVKVLKIYPDKTSKDRMILKVRVWKTPFLLPKPDLRPLNS